MLINPKHYRYTVGSPAELKCLVYDPLQPLNEDDPISGRTVKIKIQRHNDNKYLNFNTGSWGGGSGSDYETTMTDNLNGLYTWNFIPSLYGENTENSYTIIYTDRADTGDDTTWGGADYEILTFTVDPFTPPTPSTVGLIVIYGWLIDTLGRPVPNAMVEAIASKEDIIHATDASAIQRIVHSTYTADDGYWELELIPSQDIDPVETRYIFTFQKRDSYYAWVPNSPSAQNFADLDSQVGWD